MKVIMKLHRLSATSREEGKFLMDFEPEVDDGRGLVHLTDDPDRAKQFDDKMTALEYWRQDHGIRPDGKPNRPLTAFTAELIEVDD